MSSQNYARIEPLTKDNFDTWKLQVEALLIKNDAWEYVNGGKPKPAATDDRTTALAATWDAADKKARSDLVLSISPAELKQIKGCITSNDIWKKLHEIYQSKGPARTASLLKRLTLYKMAEGDDVRNHLREFFDTIDKLQEMDIEINEKLLSVMLLYSLPSNYENFRCAIESRDELPKLEALKIKIIEESEVRKPKQNGDTENAMWAKKNTYHKKPPKKVPDKGESQGQKPTNKNKQFTCYKCRRPGHKASECDQKNSRSSQDSAGQVEETSYVSVVSKEVALQIEQKSNAIKWCLDSGCTSHMCSDEDKFESLGMSSTSQLNLASDACAEVKGVGLLKLSLKDEACVRKINLKNALHVPKLRTNLISVSKITENGFTVLFDQHRAVVQDKFGNQSMICKKEGGLYCIQENEETAKLTNETRRDSKLNLWHKRLGHLNEQSLKKMASEGIIDQRATKEGSFGQCETCVRGKLARLPFPQASQRASEKLEIVHTDLCGPMRTQAISGALYFAVFIDDYSRWCEIRFMKNKSDVLEAFKGYKNFAEKQTGCQIRALQSDNGTEFCNKEFQEFLDEHGIKRRLTVPYTPQQNGVAERKNRTLVETARCLMIESNLPPSFWAEATRTANYIRNRCVSTSVGGKTPYELWIGQKPDLSNLKIFGSRAYSLDNKLGKGKFEERGKDCIFIGYSDTAKAYRVWLPESRRVEATRDVKFFNDFQTKEKYEDFVSESMLKKMMLEPTNPIRMMEVEVNPTTDETAILERDAQVERRDVEDVGEEADREENEAVEDVAEQRRGPGRPRLVHTGLRGRPRKEYAMRRGEDEPEGNIALESDYGEYVLITELEVNDEITGPDGAEWRAAIADEFRAHLKNGTWELVDRPERRGVIGCKLILKNKYLPDGTLERRTARLVAKGYAQRPGLDFRETFASVARMSSIRLIVAMATERDFEIHQLDVTTAYLNGYIEEEVYMEVPEFYEEILTDLAHEGSPRERKEALKTLNELKSGDKTCLLKRALYGLKQAGRQWQLKLCQELQKLGLNPLNSDTSIYEARRGERILIVITYVDDLIVTSDDSDWIKEFKLSLSKRFDIKDLGRLHHCLGLEFNFKRGATYVSQTGYVNDVLKRFGMENCKPAVTPFDVSQKLTKPTRPLEDKSYPYRELIGSLMYLALGTRPDICFAVSSLSQYNNCFGDEHWIAAKRVLRYLKGTTNLGLKYTKSKKEVEGFVDSDWGGCLCDRRSYTGYAFKLSGAAISWEAKKQRTVALSTTEAEYMGLTEATKEAIHILHFLKETGVTSQKKITLYNDNQGAQDLGKNPVFHSRTKHIDVRHHFIRDAVRQELVRLQYIPTTEMPADVLTKALNGPMHRNCIKNLGMTDCN